MNKICVYAICKNESQFVEQWLDSMSEADYIVVLDTGSTDDTFQKLKSDSRVTVVKRKYIKPFRFDVARNESMKLCPEDADILVCTDFDEVFESGWANVLREHWKDGANRAYYTYAWSHNESGEPEDVFKYSKIHDRNYTWIYPVHEVISPIDINFKPVEIDFGNNIYLHHYPDKTKPRAFYIDLLKTSVEEYPENCHVRMLYARELYLQDRKEESLNEFLTVLEMPEIDHPARKDVLLNSLLQVALIYEEFKNYDECLWYCQEFIKEDHTYREPYLIMAEAYCEMNMPTLAEGCIAMAKQYSYQHYSWVERSTTWTNLLEDVESICQFRLGNYEKAYKLGQKALAHQPSDERLLHNVNEFSTKYIEELETRLHLKDS